MAKQFSKPDNVIQNPTLFSEEVIGKMILYKKKKASLFQTEF